MRNLEKGFTLLEILIAMLIIAVGILGHAKMQVKSMDIGQRAGFAQIANLALLDLSQRIRVNPEAAFDSTNLNIGTPNKCSSTVPCSRDEFAKYEVKDWYDDLNAQLPLPQFSIATAGNLVTITLVWDAARTGVASGVCDLHSGNYQCGSLTVWLR